MDPFIGEIKLTAFGVIPRGWLPCNGQLLAINQNQALYSILGTTYGGDGRTTFALPNLQGRTAVHPDGANVALGSASGETTHTLTLNEIPQHTHLVNSSSATADQVSPANNIWAQVSNLYAGNPGVSMNSGAVSTTGGNNAHENRQPYLALQFIIAINGIYPTRN